MIAAIHLTLDNIRPVNYPCLDQQQEMQNMPNDNAALPNYYLAGTPPQIGGKLDRNYALESAVVASQLKPRSRDKILKKHHML